MKQATLKRVLLGATVVIVVAGAVAPFLPLPFLRPGIEQALAKRLGRRVEIGEVSLSLFGGPGFSVSNVTIHEDPRAGIEPFVYAQSVDARVDLLGLLAGRRGFSSLRFSDATLNLVRTRAGEWNFQYLLNAQWSGVPSIHLRGARVNLKFAQTKSVVYFDDADVDVTPGDRGSLDLRFAGAPARTDRPAQNSVQLVVRGSWVPTAPDRPLNVRVEMEPSSFDGLAKLFGRSWFDLQGQVSLNAQLSGTPSELAVIGEVQLDEGRRSDFLPSRDGKWTLAYRGTLDLLAEKLELENVIEGNPSGSPPSNARTPRPKAVTDAGVPVLLARLEANELLTSPQWKAAVELNDAPAAVVMDAARRIGAPLPAKVSADGRLSGALNYDADSGLTGSLEAHDASLLLPDAPDSPVVRSLSVPIALGAQTIAFGPCPVSVSKKASDPKQEDETSETQTAQVEANYKFDGSQAADFRITTRALDLEGLRWFGSVPLLGQSSVDPADRDRAGLGIWRGSLRYQRSGAEEGRWTGDYSLENARVAIDGIADPIRIQFANVSTGLGRLAVTKMRAKVGAIAFTGEYRFDSTSADLKSAISKTATAEAAKTATAITKTASPKPDGGTAETIIHRPQFKVQVGEATLAEIDRLFKVLACARRRFYRTHLAIGQLFTGSRLARTSKPRRDRLDRGVDRRRTQAGGRFSSRDLGW